MGHDAFGVLALGVTVLVHGFGGQTKTKEKGMGILAQNLAEDALHGPAKDGKIALISARIIDRKFHDDDIRLVIQKIPLGAGNA